MAKKHKHPDHINHERWLVSYADFITLLFAFFVVMFSVSQVDVKKLGKFSDSVIEAFGVKVLEGTTGVFEGTNSPFEWAPATGKKGGEDSGLPPPLVELEKQLQQQIKAAAAAGRKGGGPEVVIPGDKGSKERGDKGDAQAPDPAGIAAKSVATGAIPPESVLGIRVLRRRHELVLRLDIDVLFASGSDEIDPKALPLLQVLGEQLKSKPITIRVEGHTDNVPIHTTRFRSNWHLSTARATAVIQYYMEKLGIPPGRLGATGFGEHQPVSSNETPEGRAKNRRVDIVIGFDSPPPATAETGFSDKRGTDSASGSGQPL